MFKNTKIIAFFTLVSRVFGYLRDLLIANYFGASIYTDMFFIAFRIPNSLRRFLGEGAINSSVVPVLSKLDDSEKPKAIWNIFFFFCLLILVISILGVIFSKILVVVFAAGYLKNHFMLMNHLVKFIFPYIFFIGLTVLLMGILNSYKHFAVPAFAPTLLNVGIIMSIFLFYDSFKDPVYALAVGVLIGGFLQLALSYIDFFSLKVPFKFSLEVEQTTREMFKLMGITTLGNSVMQVSSMVDGFVASFLAAGSFSYIFYANRLFQLPYAMFSVALAQGSLPDLSKMERKELVYVTRKLCKFVVFISIVIMLYFFFFSEDVIRVLFMRGKFNEVDLLNTTVALKVMIAGFIFFSLTKILSNAFYSIKDAKTPLRASVLSSLVAISLSLTLGFRFGFVGLAISMSIAGFVNALSLFIFLNKKIGRVSVFDLVDRYILIEAVILLGLSFVFVRLSYGFIIAILFYGIIALVGSKHYTKFNFSAASRSS